MSPSPQVQRSATPSPRPIGRVAIVGAGIAGLACARELLAHGVDVVVFDKGRAPGGRLAIPRAAELVVDLGAQYFTARDPRFEPVVREWIGEGVVARWEGRVRALPARDAEILDTPPLERFVGTPTMSALAAPLARDVDVRAGHRVDVIEWRAGRFSLRGAVGAPGVTLGPRDVASDEAFVAFGAFDVVLVCLPSDQAAPLLRAVPPAFADTVTSVHCEPCLALGFTPEADALRDLPFDGLFIGRDGDEVRSLAWLARDSSKPLRPPGDHWVVHAAAEWSRDHLHEPSERVERAMLDELARTLTLPPIAARATSLRRWAFARAPAPLDVEALYDDVAKIGVGGDWAAGGRVEGAYLSGLALARRVLEPTDGGGREIDAPVCTPSACD